MKIAFFALVSLLSFSACNAQFDKLLNKVKTLEVSTEDVATGLREALTKGAVQGSELLHQRDGYFKSIYKIALPEDARQVCNKLRVIPGFSAVEDEVSEKINRAAEDAAIRAKPIFVDAIRQMTIQDAWNILKGSDDAATLYLKETTTQALYDAFQPVIGESMEKVGAVQVWSAAVNQYNQIPFVKKANPDMSDYVTRKALDGLFLKIAEEELNIRSNVSARTSDLLRKVFARQD
ncbi:MAG: DUF4197 domain-containing protein [Saprospiraceae bacterium]|nr:DUF4197 domain-containing protein [Saprospiraceae bacterium]